MPPALELDQIFTGKVYDLTITGLKSADSAELKNKNAYYTVNRLRN